MALLRTLIGYGFAISLAACRFEVNSVGVADLGQRDGAVGDGPGTIDGGGLDLTGLGAPDLAADLYMKVDFAGVDFKSRPIDLAEADLTIRVPDFPSNVSPSHLSESNAGWTITANTTIDTDKKTISTPYPSSLAFESDGNYSVISVQTMMLNSGVTVSIVGSHPLVIVAGQAIALHGFIDAGGHGATPGPSGSVPNAGNGKGAEGSASGGGGGGGFGSAGGTGGASKATKGGATYGMSGTTLVGGSGGGTGAAATGAQSCSPSAGAGGGALQLSSREITLYAGNSGTTDGFISVAGGGGAGGCSGTTAGGGGGGGSGGDLLIEAPTLNLGGQLDAAGGGGGSGGYPSGHGPVMDGAAGEDGVVVTNTAYSSRGGVGFASGGNGYNTFEFTTTTAAGNGTWSTNNFFKLGGGGGGGGAGRILVRSSKSVMTNATPTPTYDTSLPSSL